MPTDGRGHLRAELEAKLRELDHDKEAVIEFILEIWPGADGLTGYEIEHLAERVIAEVIKGIDGEGR